MEISTERNRSVGLLVLRVTLGLVFLMQGYGKVFSWGLENVYLNAFASYESMLPAFLLKATAYFTSYVELIGGLCLILGVFKSYALYALGLVLMVVSFGHGLKTPIWNLSDVVFRLVMLVALLLLPQDWDRLTLDTLLKSSKSKK